jgi:uncharacterized protein YqgV (UPF0045/DUF77 family)
MIKRFNEYCLDREIDHLFDNTNESIVDFKNKLLNLIPKVKKEVDLQKFISRFFEYIKSKNLDFKKIAMGAFLTGIVMNTTYNLENVEQMIQDNEVATEVIKSDEEIAKELEEARVDTMFMEYEKRADAYLSRDLWSDSPLSGEMFAKGAREAYEKHGVLVPVELALAQAQFESHFGTTGLSAENNPFNVGEYDTGTVMTFNSPQEGVSKYFDVMATDYLHNKTVDELLQNFVNYNGDRYASKPTYEKEIKNQMEYNKKWIDKNI